MATKLAKAGLHLLLSGSYALMGSRSVTID